MFTLIDCIEDLAFLNQELLNKPYVGVDTEFRRTTKDNMRLALLQINDDEEIYLVDTILIKNPQESASFLFSDSVTKIFHSCKEDLEAIYSWSGQIMTNIFDTQLANSFISNEYSIGYQGLVQRELGIVLDKKETRSNWTRRPLSDDQLKYAALDVEYLIHLYREQKKELIRSNKLDWHNEDIEKLIEITFSPLSIFNDINRIISKSHENELLYKLNARVESIANDEGINSTLFFSKKFQKDFLRLVFDQGLESACGEITNWRRCLIEKELLNLLK